MENTMDNKDVFKERSILEEAPRTKPYLDPILTKTEDASGLPNAYRLRNINKLGRK